MLKLSVKTGDLVRMGENLVEIISVYKDCIYITFNNGQLCRVTKSGTALPNDNIILFERKRKGSVAVIGLSSPQRIERVPDKHADKVKSKELSPCGKVRKRMG